MLILRKLQRKSPYPQSIPKALATRFSDAAQIPDPGPFDDEPFPDEPTTAYYDEQVYKAGRNRDMVTVAYLLNKRVRDGCFNTIKTFNFLTNTDSSLSVLDSLIQTLSRLNKGIPRNNAFNLLIARLCKLDRTDESLRVIDKMSQLGGYGLNAASFHPIVCALTRKKKMGDAWRVVDKMRGAGFLPDVTTYNYFLTAYCFEGKLMMARAVVKKIEEEGLVADSRTYDALVLGACKAGRVEGAMALLRNMMCSGYHVMYSTYSHVINAMLKQGYYDQAVRFVMCYAGRDAMLDIESFGVLANKLVGLGRKGEAMVVLNEMRKRGLRFGTKLTKFYELNAKNTS